MITSLLTRREPAIRRKASLGGGEVSLGGMGNWTGLSESRSRLFAGGLGCGRGRSPTDASSYRMSHSRPAECHCFSHVLSTCMHL